MDRKESLYVLKDCKQCSLNTCTNENEYEMQWTISGTLNK